MFGEQLFERGSFLGPLSLPFVRRFPRFPGKVPFRGRRFPERRVLLHESGFGWRRPRTEQDAEVLGGVHAGSSVNGPFRIAGRLGRGGRKGGFRCVLVAAFARHGARLRHLFFKGADQVLARRFGSGRFRDRVGPKRRGLRGLPRLSGNARFGDILTFVYVFKRIPRDNVTGVLFPFRRFRNGVPGSAANTNSPAGLRLGRRLGVVDNIKKVYNAFFRVVGGFLCHTGLSSAEKYKWIQAEYTHPPRSGKREQAAVYRPAASL